MLIFTRHIIIPREWNYRLRSTSFCRVERIILLLNQLWISFYYLVLVLKLCSILLLTRSATTSLIYIFLLYECSFVSKKKKEKRKNIRDIGNSVEIGHPFCKNRWIHEYQKFVCLLTDGNLFHKFITASRSGTFAKNMINFITRKSEYIYIYI